MASYAYWKAALAVANDCGRLSKAQMKKIGAPSESDPQPGFYRRRNKNGPPTPVAIWEKDGKMVAKVGAVMGDASAVWVSSCDNPVKAETYNAVVKGAPWPDQIPEQKEEPAQEDNAPENDRAVMGANFPPEEMTPEREIDLRIDKLIKQTRDWLESIGGKPRTQAEADLVDNYKNKFRDLEKEADDARAKEKEPHLKAGREIDAKWRTPIDKAEERKKTLDKIGQAYIKAENARRQAEADEANKEAAARAAEQRALDPEAPPPEVEPVKAEPVKIGGGGGRRTGLKTEPKVLSFHDLSAFAAYIGAMDAVPYDFQDVCLKIARKLTDVGVKPPGVSIDGVPLTPAPKKED